MPLSSGSYCPLLSTESESIMPRKRVESKHEAKTPQPRPALLDQPAARPTRTVAEEMATKQREISISEFFTKNRHLLGFDNPRKALLTTIKEGVDNSLDACEEAKILPDVTVLVQPVQPPKTVVQPAEGQAPNGAPAAAPRTDSRFRVVIEDNGPGIVKEQIPRIFAKLLYGSKFHRLKMSRGQQGIGISAAGMYGQLTTGKPVRITSRIAPRRPAHYYELLIDTQKNEPHIVKEEVLKDWHLRQGTRVEIELEAKYLKGKQSVDDYLEQTAIANPHVQITYQNPDNEKTVFQRAAKELPPEPKEIKPHPYGVELGMLIKMLQSTRARTVQSFLTSDFSRVSARIAKEICDKAKIPSNARPSRIARQEADNLFTSVNATKIMNPPTDCISPIGEELILKSLKKQLPNAGFYTAVSRAPSVYRGNPFAVEAGLAYGARAAQTDDEDSKRTDNGAQTPAQPGDEEPITLLRFANRVPLLYQQSACAIWKSVVTTDWRNYGLAQPGGALPLGPMTLMVHVASVWVPFTSESKEAVAHYPEIIKEIRLALQECGRQLSAFLRRRRREADALKKKSYIESYIPHIAIALKDMLRLKEKQETRIVNNLKYILEKTRGMG